MPEPGMDAAHGGGTPTKQPRVGAGRGPGLRRPSSGRDGSESSSTAASSSSRTAGDASESAPGAFPSPATLVRQLSQGNEDDPFAQIAKQTIEEAKQTREMVQESLVSLNKKADVMISLFKQLVEGGNNQ